ncbi:hypothetical protein B5X24_HaOG215483 [Helicoverpa armigera]|nr:hypothetical protein B5X24_HaOG215483 [Helicoverpa armigera]
MILSYTVTQALSPENTGAKVKTVLMMCLMVSSSCIHAIPLEKYPRLSLASTILSIPSQVNTIVFMHRYVEPVFNDLKIVVLLRLISLVSVLETIFLIHADFTRL